MSSLNSTTLLISAIVVVFLVLLPHGKGDELTEEDKLAYEAIQNIHLHLDDDRNGNVDVAESTEFIESELNDSSIDVRHTNFHSKDSQISVQDLWKTWQENQVRNWTSNEVLDWLEQSVQLPKYKAIFSQKGVNGSSMPRLAVYQNSLHNELGIKDPKDRQKIALRAMDVILFGPPDTGHDFKKDFMLALATIVAVLGCWYSLMQRRRAQVQMELVMRDIESLQQAEQNLENLQLKLMQAEQDQRLVEEQKQDLENKLKAEIAQALRKAQSLHDERLTTEEEIQRSQLAEEELIQVREALQKAEQELEYRSWRAPSALQQWLQITYEKETKHFQIKRVAALKQMEEAKEACEKVKRKRASVMGAFRLAHDLSMDDVDQKILHAKSLLAEITNELQERQNRWQQIESYCGFQITNNDLFNPRLDISLINQTQQSAIAQALAVCANIGGVGSGRRLSSRISPRAPLASLSTDTPAEDDKKANNLLTVVTDTDVFGATGQEDTETMSRTVVTDPVKEVFKEAESTTEAVNAYHGKNGMTVDVSKSLVKSIKSFKASANNNQMSNGHRGSFQKSTKSANDIANGASPENDRVKKRHSWFGGKKNTNETSRSGESPSDTESLAESVTDDAQKKKRRKMRI